MFYFFILPVHECDDQRAAKTNLVELILEKRGNASRAGRRLTGDTLNNKSNQQVEASSVHILKREICASATCECKINKILCVGKRRHLRMTF